MKVAAIVTSPLQILLAKQICEKLDYSNVEYTILVESSDPRLENLKKLAEYLHLTYSIKYFEDSYFKGKFKYVKLLCSIFNNNGFDIVIIGMYFCIFSHLISLKYVKKSGKLIYIDDGTATIELDSEDCYRLRMNSKKWYYVRLLLTLKRVDHRRYYTIFDNISSKHYDTEKYNPFSTNVNAQVQLKGIFILGTNSSIYANNFSPVMSMESFNSFIIKSIELLKDKNQEENIYYSPHGRDNSTELLDYCRKNEIEILKSMYSVEIDYVLKGYYPKIIAGPSSTALFTLKKIFPNSIVIDLLPMGFFHARPERKDKESLIKESQGIKTLTI